MKKWLILFSIILAIIIPLLWWHQLVPVPSGVYPEKHTGVVVLDMEDDVDVITYELPVRWIKTHPWESRPTLKNIQLIDSDNDIISKTKGEMSIHVNDHDNKWHERNIPAVIEIPINGERLVRETTHVTTSIDSMKEHYFLKQLNMTYKGEEVSFPMENTYKLVPISNLSANTTSNTWNIEGAIQVLDDLHTEGFIYHLSGPVNAVLEDILFWLPGMNDDYHENEILYSFEGSERYWDQPSEFKGDPIELPLTLETGELLLYFPFTEEIVEEIKDSLYRSMPFLKMNDGGLKYYTGISGMDSGLFDRGEKWENHLIMPK
ncbi:MULTISPECIES: hypothetical protein [Bacillaceae]|uniref:Uncharacterized protein n=1 Tax=Evansella alkalicola TaxID=745819 RepID=A0ABS6JNU2_9BACI|nr:MULTISPECIES: hypothetical protein [Bacillaceae]MBU9720153.1 hypothetical protein [Bacillus alkalicola]